MIKHIEDLPPYQFIDVVKNFYDYRVTEKLDGVNLVFGYDARGYFFTTREMKGGGRQYWPNEYLSGPANNAIKSAHTALQNISHLLVRNVDADDLVEVEVLFGRQPNAIVYGSNYIVPLRMIEGHESKLNFLNQTLLDQTSTVTVSISSSLDGTSLIYKPQKQTWKFAAVPEVPKREWTYAYTMVLKDLKQYENWIGVSCGEGWDFPNGDLLNLNLNSVKKDERPLLKALRLEAQQKSTKYKLQIKEHFLNVLRTIEPELRDVDVEEWEDFGIEGVVLRHKETGEQFKIVDKEVFSTINQFNHAIRNEIKNTFSGGRQKFEATLGRSYDLYNGLLENLAYLFGIEGLSRISTIKRTLRKFRGDDLNETLKNVATEIAYKMNREAYGYASSFKHAVQIILHNHIEMLHRHLDEYKENWQSYRLTPKTGVEIRYTNEIHHRTLTAFADVKEELTEMLDVINIANTPQDIVLALYGKQLLSIH